MRFPLLRSPAPSLRATFHKRLPFSHSRKPVLFLVESISICHVARPLVIAELLKRAGVEVIFAAGTSHVRWVAEKGFRVIEVPTLQPETVYGRLRRMQPTYRAEEVESYYQFDRQVVADIDPRLIIYDMRLTAPLIGRESGIPTASIANGIYSRHFFEARSTPHLLKNRFHLPQALLDRAFNSPIGRMLEPVFERPFSRPIDQVYQNHGVEPLKRFSRYLSGGDLCLVADLPSLAPLRGAGNSAIHVGPCLWDPPACMGCKDVMVPGDAPSIYMSMGTSVFPQSLVAPCIKALLDAGYRVVLQTGAAAPEVPPDHPRLQVHRYVSNLQVMRQVDLVISHGGVSTGYEALSCGVPVIGIPSFSDQQWNLDRVVAAGAGLSLNPAKVTPASLLRAANRLRDESAFSEAARGIASQIAHFPFEAALCRALGDFLPELASASTLQRPAQPINYADAV